MAAVFTAYFDAAGTERNSVLAVAGFVSDFTKWKRFESAWAKILARENVSCLHMTEFVSSQGEFERWRGEQHSARRKAFIFDLFACARKYTNKAFAAAMPMADYARINRRYQLHERKFYPFSLCGRICVDLTEKWRRKKAIDKVLYTFEDGDQHKGHLQALCREIRIEPEFVTKKCAPVQAADLLAWRTRYAFKEAINPDLTFEKAETLKETFNQAWKPQPHEAFYGEYERLEQFCLQYGIPKR